MSGKTPSTKNKVDIFDTGNRQVLADNLGQQGTGNVKSKVDFIFDAVSSRSKNDILLVLQSVDYNVEAAISLFAHGGDEEVLKTWQFQGKKPKSGNASKKKRNKKKQAGKEEHVEGNSTVPVPEIDKKDNSENDCQETEGSNVGNTLNSLSLDLKDEGLAPPILLSPSSSDTSGISDQVTPTEELPERPHPPSTHQGSQKHVTKHDPPEEATVNGHHHESLKKTVKDLSRSTFSLARYEVVLEEECENSLKRIAKTFQTIRTSLANRETVLVKSMEEFKELSVKLLEKRLEDASALKLKAERVANMSDEQFSLLKKDIKSFVSERKLDEELAQTTRFVCNEDELLEQIEHYGEVVPIKHTYTPVVLNHVIESRPHQTHTEGIKTSKAVPTLAPPPSIDTSSETNIGPAITISTTTVPASASLATTVPIPAAGANSEPISASGNIASDVLQETAEIHVRLKQVLKKQGIGEHKPPDAKQGSRGQQADRPRRQQRSHTAPQASTGQQKPNQNAPRSPSRTSKQSHGPQNKQTSTEAGKEPEEKRRDQNPPRTQPNKNRQPRRQEGDQNPPRSPTRKQERRHGPQDKEKPVKAGPAPQQNPPRSPSPKKDQPHGPQDKQQSSVDPGHGLQDNQQHAQTASGPQEKKQPVKSSEGASEKPNTRSEKGQNERPAQRNRRRRDRRSQSRDSPTGQENQARQAPVREQGKTSPVPEKKEGTASAEKKEGTASVEGEEKTRLVTKEKQSKSAPVSKGSSAESTTQAAEKQHPVNGLPEAPVQNTNKDEVAPSKADKPEGLPQRQRNRNRNRGRRGQAANHNGSEVSHVNGRANGVQGDVTESAQPQSPKMAGKKANQVLENKKLVNGHHDEKSKEHLVNGFADHAGEECLVER